MTRFLSAGFSSQGFWDLDVDVDVVVDFDVDLDLNVVAPR
jgi:hypothetical protein